MPEAELIADLSLRTYRHHSLFRMLQDTFVAKYGPTMTGRVIEIGGKRRYEMSRFFPKADEFVVTNVTDDGDVFLDATAMDFPDASQDGFVCASVLEHVGQIELAMAEIRRTLKPGGRVLVTVPFMFPVHDKVDYWRVTPEGLARLLDGFEIEHFAHLGGRITSVACLLQRPFGDWRLGRLPFKLAGAMIVLLLRRFEVRDGTPTGLGVVAVRR